MSATHCIPFDEACSICNPPLHRNPDAIPGEGETRTQIRVRRRCGECGEPATVWIGFLLENFRSNPASNAYKRDDCTRINDAEAFACEAHQRSIAANYPRMVASAWRTLDPQRNAHLFLTWEVTR